MVRETLLRWTAAGGAGGLNVLYWNDSTLPADIKSATQAFLTAIAPALCTGTSVLMDAQIRDRNTNTGALSGFAQISAPPNILGSGAAAAVPNVAQGLIRLHTGNIVGGRQLQGRMYIPGMAENTIDLNGQVTSTAVSTLGNAAEALTAPGNLVVWHRPKNGAGGTSSAALDWSVWNEFASQRRRRS